MKWTVRVWKVFTLSKIASLHVACESGNWDRRILYFRCVQSSRRPMTRYCDCFLLRKHCKIENRRNHWPNLKIINRREKSIDASGDVLLKKYWKYADYASSATFTIKEKLCSFFQINCAKNYASTISKGRPENPLILYLYGKCYRAGICITELFPPTSMFELNFGSPSRLRHA